MKIKCSFRGLSWLILRIFFNSSGFAVTLLFETAKSRNGFHPSDVMQKIKKIMRYLGSMTKQRDFLAKALTSVFAFPNQFLTGDLFFLLSCGVV